MIDPFKYWLKSRVIDHYQSLAKYCYCRFYSFELLIDLSYSSEYMVVFWIGIYKFYLIQIAFLSFQSFSQEANGEFIYDLFALNFNSFGSFILMDFHLLGLIFYSLFYDSMI